MKKKTKLKDTSCIHYFKTSLHGEFYLKIEKVDIIPRINLTLHGGDIYHFKLGSYAIGNSDEYTKTMDGFRQVVKNLLKDIEEHI